MEEEGTVSALKLIAQLRGQVRGWATQLAQGLCPLEVRGQGSGSSFSRKTPFTSVLRGMAPHTGLKQALGQGSRLASEGGPGRDERGHGPP